MTISRSVIASVEDLGGDKMNRSSRSRTKGIITSAEITPFRIAATDDQLEDLKRRLRATRWPERECVEDWSQGLPLAYAQEVCQYWLEKYDWRAREARLNRFPQFKTRDRRPRNPLHPRPLAACGCAAAGDDAWMARLDRRVPKGDRTADQPDRAWRRGFRRVPRRVPVASGLWLLRQADPQRDGTCSGSRNAWSELMPRLGYKRYAAQGGDWGAAVTTCIGVQDPANCIGIHLNMPIVRPDPTTRQRPHREGKIRARRHAVLQRLGLRLLQGTEHAAADASAMALRDSPVGQLRLDPGEVLGMDRLRRPSGERADPRRTARQRDAVLAARNAAASSARLYWESFRSIPTDPVTMPAGCSIFPKEIFRTSKRWAEQRYHQAGLLQRARQGRPLRRLRAAGNIRAEVRDCFRQMR